MKDLWVASIYGDPDSGVISSDNEFVAVAGCGITIYFISGTEHCELGTESDDILWTEGIYQSSEDNVNVVRFSAHTDENLIRVHRLNVLTRKIEVL